MQRGAHRPIAEHRHYRRMTIAILHTVSLVVLKVLEPTSEAIGNQATVSMQAMATHARLLVKRTVSLNLTILGIFKLLPSTGTSTA